MNKITSLSKKLKEFFNEKADKISITTRFIKRKRKLKGSSFVKAMVLGNIGVDNCSVETMCQLLNEDSIDITKQGLDFRFTEEAVEFIKRMYNESVVLFKISCKLIAKSYSNFIVLHYWTVAILLYLTVWKRCIKVMVLATVAMKAILSLE